MAGSWTPPTSAWTSVINGLINDTGTGSDDLWCAAKDNMRLCDVLCPGCGFGQVFIRSDCKKYVR